ncbi:nitrate/nitrite transporter [Bradyrhizobium sp. Cp5.3]|uniref:MFS transporter n=1 Tax=Bradyrhizobium sp. Cp5.3 TaxID=443598 RepID=UPI000684F2FA|nr:MFS transporter [Bradyrhizobium sp. Cp5.3]
MKPRVAVSLSDGMAARLAVAAQRPGFSKSAVVEAALDHFLALDDERPSIDLRLNAINLQLEQLDHHLRVVRETVALQARFHLAVTPSMSGAALRTACTLGSERFNEFAAQVARRVQLRTSLLTEALERVSGIGQEALASVFGDEQAGAGNTVSQPWAPARGDKALDQFQDNREDSGRCTTHAATKDTDLGSTPLRTRRFSAHLALILRVFLPFVAAYYLSFLFRTINGTIAQSLKSEFGLGADDLGLLTSIYFLTFAAAQIPIGILLDRYGPRLVQSSVLVAAAIGSAVFAVSDNFWLLLVGRALIGLGVAAALTAGLKAIILWFPNDRVPLVNGLMIMLGALGAVTATVPAEYLMSSIGWRGLFEFLSIGSAGCAFIIFLVVPKATSSPKRPGEGPAHGLRMVFADPNFWRMAPVSATCIGTAWALQGLWAAQWFSDVDRLDRPEMLQGLLIMAVASSLGAFTLGFAAHKLRQRGIGPRALLAWVALVFFAAQLALILRLPLPTCLPWVIVAAVSAATVLSYSILADCFPKELAGRANAALNVFHIGCAFIVQYVTGLVVQHWIPLDGHYPEIAYQTAFALNLLVQVVAWIWFLLPASLSRRQARVAAS